MAWTIEYEQAALDQLRKLDRSIQRRIVDYMDERIALADNPRNHGHALTGQFSRLWRYRVGDYRIVCRIEDERLVVLVSVSDIVETSIVRPLTTHVFARFPALMYNWCPVRWIA